MNVKEAEKIDSARREREAREREAAETVARELRIVRAERQQAATATRREQERAEGERALAAFEAARDALAKLTPDELARWGADATSTDRMAWTPATTAVPAALEAAIARARLAALRAA